MTHPGKTAEEKITERRDKYAWLAATAGGERKVRLEGYAAGLTLALRYLKEEL